MQARLTAPERSPELSPDRPAEERPSSVWGEPDGGELPPRVAAVARYLAQRRLGRVALMFLAAHQPAAFLVGQGLYFFAPVYDLLMGTGQSRADGYEYREYDPSSISESRFSEMEEWAAFCCRPQGLAQLTPLLLQHEFSRDEAQGRS